MILAGRKKDWHELTEAQQVGIIILSVVQVALLVGALWDIYQRPPEKINGHKAWWTLASFVNFFGPVAYFSFGRK